MGNCVSLCLTQMSFLHTFPINGYTFFSWDHSRLYWRLIFNITHANFVLNDLLNCFVSLKSLIVPFIYINLGYGRWIELCGQMTIYLRKSSTCSFGVSNCNTLTSVKFYWYGWSGVSSLVYETKYFFVLSTKFILVFSSNSFNCLFPWSFEEINFTMLVYHLLWGIKHY